MLGRRTTPCIQPLHKSIRARTTTECTMAQCAPSALQRASAPTIREPTAAGSPACPAARRAVGGAGWRYPSQTTFRLVLCLCLCLRASCARRACFSRLPPSCPFSVSERQQRQKPSHAFVIGA